MISGNPDIRAVLKETGVKQWELAEKIGIAETTLCRKLRREVAPSERDFLIGEIYRVAEYKAEREAGQR